MKKGCKFAALIISMHGMNNNLVVKVRYRLGSRNY